MASRRLLQGLALLSAFLVGMACSGVPFTIPNVPERSYDPSAGKPSAAEDTGIQLLRWFPVGVNQRHRDCWSGLERQAPGTFISDVRIQDSWTYWLVGTSYTVRMEAISYPWVSP